MRSGKGFSTGLYGWQAEYWKAGREPALDEIFRACAQAGLQAVEADPTPDVLALAGRHGLAISGAYIGLPLHEPFERLNVQATVLPAAIRMAEAGGTDLVINADPKGGWDAPQPKTEDEFERQGDNLSRIATAAGGLGLTVSMHNHAADGHNAEGDLRSVIRYADDAVGLCVDTGWAHVAGMDPIGLLHRHPERIRAFHLRNQFGRVPSEELTEGDIDMKALLNAASEIGYDGWLTFELLHEEETRAKRTLAEDTARSVAFLQACLRERQ
ncbi:sugar phosphate isomerase/epimerase [Paenibacillus sp. MWE-103]|uniref:Sugar phosphate isomerase/epimerase n=1 Tax=Paenibacillus artemisiicola TaxID=1172618 RepID=A0ABS3W8U1_9BACL|nr:sugar phosphate isomerase/epimerase [Paenibacillus artemisiicola]MBO7744719.1 sugar phosphate isomerase/epimerase [Paenibacillus artemisiicola]